LLAEEKAQDSAPTKRSFAVAPALALALIVVPSDLSAAPRELLALAEQAGVQRWVRDWVAVCAAWIAIAVLGLGDAGRTLDRLLFRGPWGVGAAACTRDSENQSWHGSHKRKRSAEPGTPKRGTASPRRLALRRVRLSANTWGMFKR
jgi:hypothetical protein